MILKQAILAAVLAAFSVPILASEGIVVGHKNVVEPDAGLLAFAKQVEKQWVSVVDYDYPAIDRLFAPSVMTFMKNETPLQPFERREDITSD